MSNLAYVVNPSNTDINAVADIVAEILKKMGVADRVSVSRPLPNEIQVQGGKTSFSIYQATWRAGADDVGMFREILPPGTKERESFPALALAHPLADQWMFWVFSQIQNELGVQLGGWLADEGTANLWTPDATKYPTYDAWAKEMSGPGVIGLIGRIVMKAKAPAEQRKNR
jgi:hypothetical protein